MNEFPMETTKTYVVWICGVEEHHDSFRSAVNAYDNWKQKGYDDVALEEWKTTLTTLTRTLVKRTRNDEIEEALKICPDCDRVLPEEWTRCHHCE